MAAAAESEAELAALGGAALAGRRVRRLLPGDVDSYEGTVVGASSRPDRLVTIHYDNGDVEELDAEDLADCLVPLPRRRGLHRRAATAGAAAAVAAAAASDDEEDEEEGRYARRTRGGDRAAPYAASGAAASRRALDGRQRRPRIASPGKRFRGTTLAGRSWKAQIFAGGTLHFSCGHKTEEDAARAWNAMARRFGRTDLNVFDEPPGGGEEAAAGGAAPFPPKGSNWQAPRDSHAAAAARGP